MDWAVFVGALAVFFASHSLPLRPRVRARLVAGLGARGFAIAYSTLSLGMLALLIHAAARAPSVVLWPQEPWHFAVVQAGMLAVFLILGLSLGRPNPFSFGGTRNHLFDPRRPGIVRFTRHPVLLALALWAGLHLLPNGDLAHVVLFGVLGGFALSGGRIIDGRARRRMGEAAWQALRMAVRVGPWLPRPLSGAGLVLRLGLAGVAYAAMLHLHAPLIGVSPF